MTNTQKLIKGVLAVCVLLGILAFFGLTPFGKAAVQNFGSVVSSDAPWYTSGFKYGNLNALYNSGSLTIANGQDQAVWTNNTGQNVIVSATSAYLNGTASNSVASSTFSLAVGATTTATIAEPYKLNWELASSTSDFPDLAITNFTFATGTPAGVPQTNLTNSLLVDNITYHASSTAALNASNIIVPPGANFYVKLDSLCIVGGVGCETATSTNRGFTTISIPFRYYYDSAN